MTIPIRKEYPTLEAWADGLLVYLNEREIDVDAALLESPPIGAMVKYPGSNTPLGWLLCNGATYPEARYPLLYRVMAGTSGLFAVPNEAGWIIRHD